MGIGLKTRYQRRENARKAQVLLENWSGVTAERSRIDKKKVLALPLTSCVSLGNLSNVSLSFLIPRALPLGRTLVITLGPLG